MLSSEVELKTSNWLHFEKIYAIQQMIEAGHGDIGRLNFILESLKNHKKLFKSDQNYLDVKLESFFSDSIGDKYIGLPVLSSIRRLIEAGIGDPGRLEHLHNTLAQGKPLFESDQLYLDNKFRILANLESKYRQKLIRPTIENPEELGQVELNTKSIEQLMTMLEQSNLKISKLEKLLSDKQSEVESPAKVKLIAPELRGSMPKDWSPPKNLETTEESGIYERIKTEQERLDEQKRLKDEITNQQSKLTQIILNREEYEKQVARQREQLKEQVDYENQIVEKQSQLMEQIEQGRRALEQAKKERIKIEKDLQKEQQALKEQEKIIDEVQKEGQFLEKIKEKRATLARQVQEERNRFFEAQNIPQELRSQESSLSSIKTEKQKIQQLVKTEENELKQIKKEQNQIQKEIQARLKEIEKSKKSENDKLSKITALQKKIAKEIEHEKTKLSAQANKVQTLQMEEGELEQTVQNRKSLEKELAQAKKDLETIKHQRTKLDKEIESQPKVTGYCVKCKKKQKIKDAKTTTLKNGRPALKGTCVVCGTKMFRIGKA